MGKKIVVLMVSTLCFNFSGSACAGILGLDNPAEIAEGRAAYASGTVFAGNDFAPIQEIRADLQTAYEPRNGRNLAIVVARAASGVDWQGYRLGAVYRQEWLAEVQKETLDAYRNEHLGLNHPVGQSYGLDYRLHGFEASGVQLGKVFHTTLDAGWSLSTGLSASLLSGQTMRAETWSGQATAMAAQTLAVNSIDATRRNTELDTRAQGFVPAYRDGNPRGTGVTVDIGLRLKRADGMRFDWVIGDALSRIRWTSVPEVTLTGSGVFNGAFPGGRKWRVDLDQHLPIKHALSLTIPLEQAQIELSDEIIRGQHLPMLAGQIEVSQGWAARLDYDVRFKSLGVGLIHKFFHLGLRTDRLDLDRARSVGLNGGVKFSF